MEPKTGMLIFCSCQFAKAKRDILQKEDPYMLNLSVKLNCLNIVHIKGSMALSMEILLC